MNLFCLQNLKESNLKLFLGLIGGSALSFGVKAITIYA